MFVEVKRNPNTVKVPQAYGHFYYGAEFAMVTDGFESYDDAKGAKDKIFETYAPACDASTIKVGKDVRPNCYWFDFITDDLEITEKEVLRRFVNYVD